MKSLEPKRNGRTLGSARSFAALFTTFTALVVGCGEDASLVGGACRVPYVECHGSCVDLESDPMNCGGCGLACAAGVVCKGGVCGGDVDEAGSPSAAQDGSTDALVDRADHDGSQHVEASGDATTENRLVIDSSVPDGSSEDAATVDAAVTDAAPNDAQSNDGASDAATSDSGTSDAGTSDAGTSDAGVPDVQAPDAAFDANADACAPPYVSDDHCGDCFTKCDAPKDTCKLGSSGTFSCAPFCEEPLVRCGNTCKDLENDGDNCGACGRVCASNICIKGVCQGAASGDIVYIGHDYATTPVRTAQARVLENAVLLSPKTPVRVLAYQRYASAGSAARVQAILSDAQSRTGRSIQYTTTTSDAAVAAVTHVSHEVVLVLDQVSAPDGVLSSIGASWKTVLANFTHVGGVFVALDGTSGTKQMPELVTQTGLLEVTGHATVTPGELLELIAPTDGVAIGVVSPFAMRANTARFTTEPNGNRVSYVVRHQSSSEPHVIHKIAP